MIALLLASVIAVALAISARNRDVDLPQRIAMAATYRLPASRSAWGQALVAELSAIPGRGQRWRFAAAVLRIALFPPIPKPVPARVTVAIGALLTVAATLTAIRLLPTLSVFVASLGLLTTGYATAIAYRTPRLPANRVQLAAAVLAVIGVLAATGAVFGVATIHPSATNDQTHIFSIVLAVALGGYLIAGLSASVTGTAARLTGWGAVVTASAILSVAASTLLLPGEVVAVPISPIIAAATLATTLGVAAVSRNWTAARRAGLITAVLSTPIHFATALLAAQCVHQAMLTDSYDVAAYPHSGYPDVASYLLSDTLAGNIVSLAGTAVAIWALAAVTPRPHRGRPTGSSSHRDWRGP